MNESLYRDILNGPNKSKASPHSLQQASSFLRNPPRMLEVSTLLLELREAADRRIWDTTRNFEKTYLETHGQAVPKVVLLTADEAMADYAENPQVFDRYLTGNEIRRRLQKIDGWMKKQFRLRLFYRKSVGKLKGNPEDLLSTFKAGPNFLDTITIEIIQGLSYDAQLDPEPAFDELDA